MKKIILFLFITSISLGLYINKPPLGRKINYSLPLGRDVIAAYMFNEKTGDIAIDRSLNHHYGTLKPATDTTLMRTISDFGHCLSFDGTGDYVEIADHADFTPALTPFSISAWVYIHDATNFYIASKGKYNTDAEWRFGTKADDCFHCRVFDENVDNCYLGREYNVALAENVWLHLVFTYSGGTTSASCKLYQNGVRVDNANHQASAASFITVQASGHDVWLGRNPDTYYANGLIDNVMFYKSALTANEVHKLYRAKYSMF